MGTIDEINLDRKKRNSKRNLLTDIILPIFIWATIVLGFLNIKEVLPDFILNNTTGAKYTAKTLLTILFPLSIIYLFYKDRKPFGVYFPKFSESFKLAFRAYAACGPAGMSFLLIAALGWSFKDWYGALTLSFFYLIAFYFVLVLTKKLPRTTLDKKNEIGVLYFLMGSIATTSIALIDSSETYTVLKISYYIFIVAFGEELLFRGYIQSAFNKFFDRTYVITGVRFGWGLILSATLFGLIHALTVKSPIWPWALFTFILGLVLGFIREKEGSILGSILLHAFVDIPLAFVDAY